MKKKALMKLLAVSIAASMMFTGCAKTEEGTSETSKESVVESVSTETAKTSETTAASETAKTTESAAKESEAKTESTASADVEVTELDKTMYVTKLINVRSGPPTKYERVTSLKKGQEVHVTGQTSDGWFRLDLDGKEAWCQEKELTDEAPAN